MVTRKTKLRIVHEVSGRLRLRGRILSDPDLDAAYLEAWVCALPGVASARVNNKAWSITVEYDCSFKSTRTNILERLSEFPVEAFVTDAGREGVASLSGVLAKAAFAAATPFLPMSAKPILSWLMGLPIIAEGANTLVSEGVKVEVLDASVVGFSLLRKDYFTANTIVAMLGLGGFLEEWTEQQSNDLLKNLLRPQVENVWIERDAQEVSVPFTELVVGDIVICGAGELVPVDGVVTDGEAAVNTSSITGESLPLHIAPGDKVLSGSVVEDGRLKIAADTVGGETSMARISRFLENSLRSGSVTQKKNNKLADSLVPVTFGLGLALFALTRDVRRAASVLTVDYSCAIKVAAPVAVKSAMYAAGHCGVLLKGAQALENLALVDTVIFDKTGTLTRGELKVTDLHPFVEMSSEDLLALAAGAEEHYAHPVARAVVSEARERGLELPPISQVDFIVAHGVSAFVRGEQVLVGSRHFLEDDEGVDCSAAEEMGKGLRSEGKSLLYVAKQGKLLGVIAMRDEQRPEAVKALAMLKERGIKKVVMLTGDHRDTAKAIAQSLGGIDEVYSELKPEDKATILRSMQDKGDFVAFAGDGVNDAPALLSADVGICMPGGADLARETAQVVLLEDDLMTLAIARDMAVKTQKVLKRSFQAAVGVNSGVLLLAATGRISPITSAFLHNASTLGILGYAAAEGGRKPSSAKVLSALQPGSSTQNNFLEA